MRWGSAAAVSGAILICACNESVLEPRHEEPARPIGNTAVVDTGYIFRNGVAFRVVFEIRSGRAIFEGDIDLGPAAAIARTLNELLLQPQRTPTGVVQRDHRWGLGLVPY